MDGPVKHCTAGPAIRLGTLVRVGYYTHVAGVSGDPRANASVFTHLLPYSIDPCLQTSICRRRVSVTAICKLSLSRCLCEWLLTE